MGKFILCFVFAFAAIQISSGASVKSHTELETVVALVAKASRELAHLQEFIGKHISPVARDFEYKIQEVLEEKAIYPVIENLSNEITQIESEISEDFKSCTETAWTETATATESTKRGIDDCISAARLVEADLKKTVEDIDGKTSIISEQLTTGYHQCLEEVTDEDKVTCLNAFIYPTLDDIRNLEAEIHEAHHSVNHVFEEGVRHLKMCLQGVKHDAEAMSETILNELKECAQIAEPTTVATILRRSTRGILDIFRDLKEKIEAIIHLATHLPTSLEELQDKINEIIAHVNMHLLISQLKSEVNDIIDQGGRNAEKCRPDANRKMNDLMKTSEAAATVCMSATEANVDAIQDKIHAVVEEAKDLLVKLNKKMLNCMLDNPLNPIAFTKCLEASYNDFKEKVALLQDKASNVIVESTTIGKDTIQEFSKCMNDVQLGMIKKGQVIISETEECVRFA